MLLLQQELLQILTVFFFSLRFFFTRLGTMKLQFFLFFLRNQRTPAARLCLLIF